MTDIPAEAVTAAAEAIETRRIFRLHFEPELATLAPHSAAADFATAALEAAAPLITAAERERIRQLATEYRAVYYEGNWKDGTEPWPFADLIAGDSQ